MANANRREEIQKILSSLLVSRKESLTIEQLDRDYKELEGEHIPWRELGCISLLSFLQSIPRHVKIENRNGVYIALPVVSDKIKHVDSLVCRQKVNKKPVRNRRTFKPSQYYPQVSMPKLFFPANLLQKIVHLVNKNSQGIHVNYILYQLQVHHPNLNISLSDLITQLRNISHQVTVRGNYVYSVENEVQAQFSFCPSNNLPNESANKPESPREITPIKVSPAGDEEDEAEEEISYEENFHFIPAGYTQKQEIKNCDNSRKATSSFIQETILKYQIQQGVDVNVLQNNENEQTNGIGYEDSKVEDDQRQTAELNYTDYQEDMSHSRDESICDIVNPRTLFRLEKLIQMHPDGIWCADLPKIYNDEYGIPLYYNELGFASVCDFAANLPNIFHCVKLCETGDFMLFDAKNPVPELERNERPTKLSMASLYYDMYEEDTDAIPMTLMSSNSQKLIPEGAMSFGESVGQVSVTELGQGVKCYEEVLIAEVFTPSCFWIQLRKKQSKFLKLMNDIHNFYMTQDKSYVIPPVVLEKGLNCACIYNSEWHRAIIKSVKPNGYVTVLFYDFGTIKTCPPEEIYFLHRSFSYMPAQAIPCGLYNVKPCNGTQWTRGASCEFLWKTEGIPLIAIIVNVDVENNSMLVSLVDTEEEEDVHINDWMVQENLAVYGSMGDTVDLNDRFIEDEIIEAQEENSKTRLSTDSTESTIVNLDDEFKQKENEQATNMPLISPRSTLNKKPTSVPPGFTLPPEPSNLAAMLNENTRDIFHSSYSSTENTLPKISTSNTNPFVQTESMYDTFYTQNILEIWKQNLQLQMQIAATFKALFSNITSQTVNNSFDSVRSEENGMPVPQEPQHPISSVNSCPDTFFEHNNYKPAENVTMKDMPNTAYNACSCSNKTDMTNVESNNLFAQSTAADSDEYLRMFSKEIPPASINETLITSTVNGDYENSKTNDMLNVDRPCGESKHLFKEFSENCYMAHSSNADSMDKNSNKNVGHIFTEDKLLNKFNLPQGNTIARNDYESKLFQDAVTNSASEYFEQTRFDSKDAQTFDGQSLKETNPFKMHILDSHEYKKKSEVQDTDTFKYKTPPPVPKRNPNLINKTFRNTKNHNQNITNNVNNITTKIVYEGKPVMYNVQDRKQATNSAEMKCENIKETVKHFNNNNNKSVTEPERPEYFQNVTNNNPECLLQTTTKMNNIFADTILSSQEKVAETDFTTLKKSHVEWNNLTNLENVRSKPDTYHTQSTQRDTDNVNKLHSMDRENRSFVNSLNSLNCKMNNCHIADTFSEKFSTNLRQNFNSYSTTPLQPRIVSSNYRPPPPPYKEITESPMAKGPVSPQIVTPAMTELSKVAIEELSIKFDIPDNVSEIDEGYITRPSTSHTSNGSSVYTPLQTTFKQDFTQDYTISGFTSSSPMFTDELSPTIFSNVLPTLLLKSVENARTSRSEISKLDVWKRSSMSLQNKWLKHSKKRDKSIFSSMSNNNFSEVRTYYQKLQRGLNNLSSKYTSHQSAASTELQHLLGHFNLQTSSFQNVPIARNLAQGSCLQTIHNVTESINAACNTQYKEISKDAFAMYTTAPTRAQTITCTNKLADTVHVTEATNNSSILMNHERINLNDSTATCQKEFAFDAKLEMEPSINEDILRSRTETNSSTEFLKTDNVSVSEAVGNLRVSLESKEIDTIEATVNLKQSTLLGIDSSRNKDAVESELISLQSCNSKDLRDNVAVDLNFSTSRDSTGATSCTFFTTELKHRTIYIFHLDEEGWVPTDDFVELFTNFKLISVMLRLLDIININVPFKVLTRLDQPLIFSQLDKSTLNVPRNAEFKIKEPIHLTPLKSVIRLLVKLKIVSHEEVRRAVVKKEFNSNTVLYNIMKLIAAYGAYIRTP